MSRPAIVVMGVAGCGKSTAGALIAERLGAAFVEGDRLHPPANVEKMAAGTPLADEDRWPWLDSIGAEIARHVAGGEGVVAACSALKRVYRDRLRATSGAELTFVFLSGTKALIGGRMNRRTGHFFPASLLDSQFATLEPPRADELHVVADLELPVETMVDGVMTELERISSAERI